MQELPDFRPTHHDYAQSYAAKVFGDHLHSVTPQSEGYFQATFSMDYFTLQPGADQPSKSQWNTLKKRMKRVHPGVFVLRDHGITAPLDAERLCYVSFGFLQQPRA
jgi:hypothetical protein